MDVTPTWHEVSRRIVGLWPRFDPTDAERDLIATRLSRLNMRWLDAAVDNYRCESESTVFRIAELLDHYRRISQTGESTGRVARPSIGAQAAEQRKAVEEEADRAREFIAAVPRATVAEAVAWLRAQGWIGGNPLPPRVSEWRSSTVLMVKARIDMAAEADPR